MAQGFLAGLLWGGVAGVGLLAVSTQVIVRQDISGTTSDGAPDAAAVEVPAGTEFDQARPATDPEIPAEETRPGGEAVSDVSPPADLGTTPPAFDTSALEMPQPALAPDGLGEVPTPAEEVTVDVTGPGETAPERTTAQPLAAPADNAAAPETDTAAPEIAAPGTDDTTAPEAATDTASDVPAITEIAPEMAGEPAGSEPETPDAAPVAPTAPDAPSAMRSPVVPSGSDAPVVEPESQPARPEVEAAPSQPVIAQVEAPADAPQSPAPIETEAPAEPEAEETAPVEEPEEAPEAEAEDTTPVEVEAEPTSEEPVEADVDEPVEVAPIDVAEAPEPEGDAPSDAGDDAPETVTIETPEVEAEGEVEMAEAPVEEDPVAAPTAPRVRPAPGEGGNLPRVIRLIGDDEEPATAAPQPEVAEAAPVDPDAPAIERFRVPVEVGLGDAIMSLVILHEGAVPDASAVAALPPGLAFAVDAGDAEAEAVARAYRAAGREVVLIPNLPENARPQDVEQAMQANLRAVPEAVAVMDTTGGGFQSDREAVAQVVDAIGATGHGLITFPRGLNTAHQRAEREGVPRGLIFRDIDGDGESGDEIGRSLDRAAFRARQSRQPVILVGRSSDDTLTAVTAWATEKGSEGVLLAPVSAALLAGN